MAKRMAALMLSVLIALSAFPAFAAGAVLAQPSDWTVYVDGEVTALRGYNIGGTNYYKLRDVAMAVQGTQKQFQVEWISSSNEIRMTSNTAYTSVGGELSGAAPETASAYPTKSPVYLDGVIKNYNSYYINGNNYFRLRELLESFDIGLRWDGEEKTVRINTTLPYGDDQAPSADASDSVVLVRKLDKDRNVISESLGFVISNDGKIATVFNAINGADIVTVSFPGEAEQDIQGVIAYNAARNIAVIKSTLKADAPLVLAKGKIAAATELFTYENSGKNRVDKVTGRHIGEIASVRTDGARDIMVSFRLAPNSVGAPVISPNGEVAGIAYQSVHQGRHQMVAIPAEEISALNLNAAPKSMEAFRREVFPMRGNASAAMLSDMLYNEIAPLRIGDERIDVFGVRAEITDPVSRRMFIRIYIPENDGDGYYFREHSLTMAGAEKIFSYCRKMLQTVSTYFPEYEVEGEILCVMTKIISTDENGRVTDYEVYDNEYHYGRKVTFAFGSEHNGWEFEIE